MTKSVPYSFATSSVEPIPNTDHTMTSVRSGLEARFADRFAKFAGVSSDSIKLADSAKNVASELRTSAGVIDTQIENINELFTLAELMIKTVDDLQRQSGRTQVKNMPLPSNSIKASAGKKLGYVKLCMKFMNAGLLHFMEQSMNLEDHVKERNNVIRAISEEMRNVPIIGRLQDVDLDDLHSADPVVDTKLPLESDDEDSDYTTKNSNRDSGVSMGSTKSSPAKQASISNGSPEKVAAPLSLKPDSKPVVPAKKDSKNHQKK